MVAMIGKTLQEVIRLLPASVARGLLFLVLLIAGWAHYSARQEMSSMREESRKQSIALRGLEGEFGLWKGAVNELTKEVIKARELQAEELKELRRGRRQ